MSRNYYRFIGGKKHDSQMIAIADEAVAGRGDGRISLEDAKLLLSSVKDANKYTDIEKSTMRYIRDHYRFTPAADQWFRTEIRKWAAKKSALSAFLFRKKVDKPSPAEVSPVTQEPSPEVLGSSIEPPSEEDSDQGTFPERGMESTVPQDSTIPGEVERSEPPPLEETHMRESQSPLKRTASRKYLAYWIFGLGGGSLLVAWFFLASPPMQKPSTPPDPQPVVRNVPAALPPMQKPPTPLVPQPEVGKEPAVLPPIQKSPTPPDPQPAIKKIPAVLGDTEKPDSTPVEKKPKAEPDIVVSEGGKKDNGEAERKMAGILDEGKKGEVYTVRGGDTLWGIAGRVYGDSFLWPVLLRANSNLGRNPDLIRPSMKILVPPLKDKSTKISTVDQAEIAEGYAYVYLAYKKAGKRKARLYLREAVRRDPTVMERLPNLKKP